MRAATRWLLAGAVMGLLFTVPAWASDDCDGCTEAVRECGKAIKVKLGHCKRECRHASRDRGERLTCLATCREALAREAELCRAAIDECVEDCAEVVDGTCPRECKAALDICISDAKAELVECVKGDEGCRESARQNRSTCRGMDPLGKKACSRVVKGAFGGCLHDCGKDAAAKVRRCGVEFARCVADCAPPCEEAAFPECGGRCPPVLGGSNGISLEREVSLLHTIFGSDLETQVCEPRDDGSGCECVPTGIRFCGHTHPQCDGDCPPGLECESIEDGVACGCRPIGNVRCGEAEAPTCDGGCPPGETCQEFSGECLCAEPPRLPCGEVLGPPICLGECPPETPICANANGACDCVEIPEPPPCGEIVGLGVCAGVCPPELPICMIDPNGVCGCIEPPDPPECGDANAPMCKGVCPEGEMCIPDFPSHECRCIGRDDLACGEFFGPPLCMGLCPAEAPLCLKTDDGTCQCRERLEPPPCGPLFDIALPGHHGFPICGGVCPPETPVCRDVGGGVCDCTELPEPPPCGELSDPVFPGLPLCGGECPADAPICADLGGGCDCWALPDGTPCGETSERLFPGLPICGGECPPERPLCLDVGESCQCKEIPHQFPCDRWPGISICAGACPDGQLCGEVEGGECACSP